MKKKTIYWPTTLFLIITPIIAAVGVPLYFYYEKFPTEVVIFAIIFAALTNLSITAGYHRLMAHKSYEAHPIVRAFFLLIGASAWQGSALKWASDHRRHHAKVDSKEDPYSIKEGFWHAHMGWLFFRDTVDLPIHAPDLSRDRLIYLQDKYYMPLAITMSFGLPTWFGLMFGDPWAGLLIGGALRVVLTQQSTFFVNSLSHTLGKQTYSDEVSARDSIIVAILTHGEGYHNFHHQFQNDYRNGIRWYHWDPTKWTIWALYLMGLAKKLRKISEQEILKAKLQVESIKLKSKGLSDETLAKIRNEILSAQNSIRNMRNEIKALKKDMSQTSHEKMAILKHEIQLSKLRFNLAMRTWRHLSYSRIRIN